MRNWLQRLRIPQTATALSLAVFCWLSLAAIMPAGAADTPPMMVVPGKFDVGRTGAATYSIPIIVPPGTAGLVPDLSLDYSSQNGNGIVGLGWTLSGLSSITRCPRTFAQDGIHGGVNYDMNDRFCLDGQRLIAISGTYGADGSEYRTEIESFTKIIAHGSAGNGPAWFEVHKKSGETLQFGNTADSQVQAVGKTTARAWMVNKISDTKGNYITVTYTDDQTNGQVYPTRVDYTGHASSPTLSPYNSVQFAYNTARPDTVWGYHAGSIQQTTVLLTDIKTYAGATLVEDYKLAYRLGSTTLNSRVTSVTLCDGNNNCLAPTTFGWQGGNGLPALTQMTQTIIPIGGLAGSGASGDFDGDGLIDVLGTVTGATCSSINLGSATGNTFTAGNFIIPNFNNGLCNSTTSGGITTTISPVEALNITGNGLTDLELTTLTISQYSAFKSSNWSINSGQQSFTSPINIGLFQTDFVDANGDSLSDEMFIGGTSSPLLEESWGSGDGHFGANGSTSQSVAQSSVTPGDFDGDGCVDALLQDDTYTPDVGAIVYSCSPAIAQATIPDWMYPTSAPIPFVYIADFNGDGLADVLQVDPAGHGASLQLSTGTGLVQSSFVVPSDWYKYTIVTGDFNGDGKADLALIADGNAKVLNGHYGAGTPHAIWLSTGDGFVLAATIPNSDTSAFEWVADWNNDGASDVWIYSSNGTTAHNIENTFSHAPELITSISNGIGATTAVTYDRLNKNGSFYKKCSSGTYVCGDTYPVHSLDGAFYAVSRVDNSNGIGGTYSATYAYAMGKSDLQGRGFLGFAQVTVTDMQTGIVQQTNYRQDYPYIGLVASQTKSSGTTTLSSTTNTYTASNLGGTRNFVSLQQSVVTGNDLDGSAYPTVTTGYTYDAYGNALTVNATRSTDGSTSNTTNTYSNDTTNWFLGRLTGTSVTNTVPDGGGGGGSNQPPTAVNDSTTTPFNTADNFDPRGNDSDPEGDVLTIIASSTPPHGTVVINSGTSLTYTPNNYSGPDSFTYTISDGHGNTATATVSVTVQANQPPTAVNDSITTLFNTSNTFDPRTNDTDPENDALTITTTSTPSHGSVVNNGGMSLTYAPANNYSGGDSFTYTINDGHGNNATATVSVTVQTDQPPTAVNDHVNTPVNIAASFDPRVNDSDPENDPLTITTTSTPSHGAVVINSGTSLTYTPANNYNGSDSFTYTISDGHGNTASATVSVTVGTSTPKVVFLTSGTSWTVPSDWNSSNNKIEAIGAGGNGVGSASSSTGGGGGGGGAYASISNFAATPGAVIPIQIGAGGSSTTTQFNNSSTLVADYGRNGWGGTGGAGGTPANSVGAVRYAGGAGGSTAGNLGGAGGGGAAGPFGTGQAGGNSTHYGGGGGGGADGGSSTAGLAGGALTGGNGGDGTSGSGHGIGASSNAAGGAGIGGGGGGGGATDGSTYATGGGAGGSDTAFDGAHGSGGGGGAGAVGVTAGGNAAVYGGGGGGGGSKYNYQNSTGGAGAQGIIVITYTP